MTYSLFIGDQLFSSWSLRGWLMLQKFDLPFDVHMVGLYTGTMQQDMAALSPARFVPVLKTPEGDVVGESLAIAETLAERHPDKHLWPRHPAYRMRARWLCTEMATGFAALRGECPMQLAHVNRGFLPTRSVLKDLERIEEIWRSAREISGEREGWLFGEYSLADAFFAPVAARIIGYNLPVTQAARDYCLRLISEPAFRSWRQSGLEKSYDPFPYSVFEPLNEWPID